MTGKGGTGKSTVAAALALALASHGKQVLLCEVEGRQGIARMFDVDPLPYEERRIATGLRRGRPAAGTVHALHIDAESALLEYLAMYYKLGRAGRALDRFGVIEFATTIAPGVRDVLLTGKVFEAVQRNSRNKGARAVRRGRARRAADRPDHPVPQRQRRARRAWPRSGPIKHQADTMMTLFRSPRTAVHLVTRAGGDAGPGDRRRHRPAAGRRAAGRRRRGQPGPAARPRRQGPGGGAHGHLDRGAIEADLAAAGVDVDAGAASTACSSRPTTTPNAGRSRTPSARSSSGLDVPTYELPRLAGGVDLGGLYELAAALKEQGLA